MSYDYRTKVLAKEWHALSLGWSSPTGHDLLTRPLDLFIRPVKQLLIRLPVNDTTQSGPLSND